MSIDITKKAFNFARALVTGNLSFEFERMPYRLENVSSRKLGTIAFHELNRLRARPLPPRYPVQLQIEPSSTCTLKCSLCPAASVNIKDQRRLMEPDTFRALLDEVGDCATIAILWMWGEPFTNPALHEMISYAHAKNVAVVTSTNGQHIQSREEAEALVASGLDNLIVALDGATQETYAMYRRGGDINKLLHALQLIRQAKDTFGMRTPLVNVRTVVNRYNEHELLDIEGLARWYGADMVSRKTLQPIDHRQFDLDDDYVPENSEYLNFKHRNNHSPSRNTWRCLRPWNRITVSSQGVVLPCEFDFNQSEAFGQGGTASGFLEAWRNSAAADFRRRIVSHKSTFPFCEKCPCEWHRSGRHTTTYMVHLTPQTVGRI